MLNATLEHALRVRQTGIALYTRDKDSSSFNFPGSSNQIDCACMFPVKESLVKFLVRKEPKKRLRDNLATRLRPQNRLQTL